jgi:hypothetical protein
MSQKRILAITLTVLLALVAGCESKDGGGSGSPEAVQQALTGEPRPSLLLTHAWFYTDADGKPRPGPARLDIWREGGSGWALTRLEDADSNVFHKAIPYNGGILTIGAERAMLKHWTFADGKWSDETLWEKAWGGRFNRLRDLEIGDVDGDGKDELVIATHDAGVVAVIDPAEDGGAPKIVEMDQKADTFVHEIEIGDIDGDGKLEFFTTPSDRNKADHSQAGGVSMYRWDGSKYVRSWVDIQEGTHAKEILAADIDGDGTSELFSVLEAELDPNDKSKLKKPVEIRQYTLRADGGFDHHVVGTIPDRQTRFLLAGDFDGDGQSELIAAAFRTGIYRFIPRAAGSAPGKKWKSEKIASDSSGFEHAAYAADLDGDGKLSLFVAADDQGELARYDYDGKGGFTKTVLGKLDKGILTWNITSGTF